jgi:murein DD-endopeptidase MepM/ murein hydrolase activator NlpD
LEKKFKFSDNPNAAKIIYGAVIALLCITAVIIGIVAANSRHRDNTPEDNNPPIVDENGGNGTQNDENQNTPNNPENPDASDKTGFIAPIAGTVMKPHSNEIPVFSQTMGDYRTHLGVDVLAPLGTEVVAVADGTVKNIWDDPFMGKCIAIEHSGNAVSIYKNLAPEIGEWLEVGCPVNKGDVIGNVGESAMNEIAEEPHLHYELKVDDTYVDPKDHFTFPTVDTNYEDSVTE